MSVTRFPTNPCFAAQLPLGELTQLAQCLVSLPSPLSMWSSRVPSRSRFVLILVNVSVTALPLAFRRARANRDSDLPLSNVFVLSISSSRYIVDECADVPPIVPNLSSFITLHVVAVPVRRLLDHHDSEHPMVIVRFPSEFPYLLERLALHRTSASGTCRDKTFGENPFTVPRPEVL